MTATSERCETGRHFDCDGCGCTCHPERKLFDDTAAYGKALGVDPLRTRDLLAHLRSGAEHLGALSVQQAARVVRYIVDLGWRPS